VVFCEKIGCEKFVSVRRLASRYHSQITFMLTSKILHTPIIQ
jgi:hypothetical protein